MTLPPKAEQARERGVLIDEGHDVAPRGVVVQPPAIDPGSARQAAALVDVPDLRREKAASIAGSRSAMSPGMTK